MHANLASVIALRAAGAPSTVRIDPTREESHQLAGLLERSRREHAQWIISDHTNFSAHAAWMRAQNGLNVVAEHVLERTMDVTVPSYLRVLRNGRCARLFAVEAQVESLGFGDDAQSLAWYVAGRELNDYGLPTGEACRVRIDGAQLWVDEPPPALESAARVVQIPVQRQTRPFVPPPMALAA